MPTAAEIYGRLHNLASDMALYYKEERSTFWALTLLGTGAFYGLGKLPQLVKRPQALSASSSLGLAFFSSCLFTKLCRGGDVMQLLFGITWPSRDIGTAGWQEMKYESDFNRASVHYYMQPGIRSRTERIWGKDTMQLLTDARANYMRGIIFDITARDTFREEADTLLKSETLKSAFPLYPSLSWDYAMWNYRQDMNHGLPKAPMRFTSSIPKFLYSDADFLMGLDTIKQTSSPANVRESIEFYTYVGTIPVEVDEGRVSLNKWCERVKDGTDTEEIYKEECTIKKRPRPKVSFNVMHEEVFNC